GAPCWRVADHTIALARTAAAIALRRSKGARFAVVTLRLFARWSAAREVHDHAPLNTAKERGWPRLRTCLYDLNYALGLQPLHRGLELGAASLSPELAATILSKNLGRVVLRRRPRAQLCALVKVEHAQKLFFVVEQRGNVTERPNLFLGLDVGVSVGDEQTSRPAQLDFVLVRSPIGLLDFQHASILIGLAVVIISLGDAFEQQTRTTAVRPLHRAAVSAPGLHAGKTDMPRHDDCGPHELGAEPEQELEALARLRVAVLVNAENVDAIADNHQRRLERGNLLSDALEQRRELHHTEARVEGREHGILADERDNLEPLGKVRKTSRC